MKIGVKLSISYAMLLIVLVAVILLSINGLSSMDENNDKLAYDRFPKTVWANTFIDQLNLAARALRNAILTDDPAVQKEELSRVLATTATVNPIVACFYEYCLGYYEHQ